MSKKESIVSKERTTKTKIKTKTKKEIIVGTIRIKSKNLEPYKKTKTGWKLIKKGFPELMQVVKLFKSNNQFEVLVDKKNEEFLKGQLSPEGREQGARINFLLVKN